MKGTGRKIDEATISGCIGFRFPRQPIAQHVIQPQRQLAEPSVLLFEQTAGDGMIRAGRDDAGAVVDDDEEIADVAVVFEVGAQARVAPGWGGDGWLGLGGGGRGAVVGFDFGCFDEFGG